VRVVRGLRSRTQERVREDIGSSELAVDEEREGKGFESGVDVEGAMVEGVDVDVGEGA
jgi:hypothetical protein